jgi:hypothetical protein
MVFVIGNGPTLSNISSAPACSSYSTSPLYDDEAAGRKTPWEVPDNSDKTGNCTTVSGIIVDQRSRADGVSAADGVPGLWKLLTGDESQYVDVGPYYPNSTTNFDSQVCEPYK